MAGFDYEVGDDFVHEANGFGEGGRGVAVGVEHGFYYGGEVRLWWWRDKKGWGWRRGGGSSLSDWKLSWPLWRAARARGSVISLPFVRDD